MKIFKCLNKSFIKISKKKFGIASFYSKYVIIGSGFAGLTLANLLTSKPYEIKGEQITLIDVIPDYTVYPLLKYHCYGNKNIVSYNKYVPDILPNKIKFRNNEILQIDPNENLLLGDQSLRQTYDKLILACGKEPDFAKTPGLLFSLQDSSNPIFTIYEYEYCIPKMANYSQMLIKQFLQDYEFKVTKKNENFMKNGGGNIIFSNCTGNMYEILYSMQMIILLYDLLKIYRPEYLNKNNFLLFLPVTQDQFKKSTHSDSLNSFFLKLLEERNINIKWDHKLDSACSEQTLIFENGNKKENYEYNFAFVMPHLELPSFLRFSSLFKNNNLDIDRNSLKINETENISIIGDALSGNNNTIDEQYLDRFDTNIFQQAQVLSNNLKINHFRLEKNKIKSYSANSKIYFDFFNDNYVILDTNSNDGKKNVELLKKTYFNNFLFGHLYYRQEGVYAQKLLLQRKFSFKII